MKFDMSIKDNYASFIDEITGRAVFVDSFDNQEFEVRIGTINESERAGIIIAVSTDDLNYQLKELYLKFQGEK